MIKVDFGLHRIKGSQQLVIADLNDAAGLVGKLKDGVDPVSTYLRESLSNAMQQELQQLGVGQSPSDSLRDSLISELNELFKNSSLYQKKRFKGTTWTREKLMRALIKHSEAVIEKGAAPADLLICLNRLLMEELYPKEIAQSPRAEWDAWNFLANSAKANIIDQWEDWKFKRKQWKQDPVGPAPEFSPALDDDVWKGFRDWLKKNAFNNKCAYCETKITGFPGDTEHFRPKGRVRRTALKDDASEIVKVSDEDGEEITHPGYFWLAYHWQNLLPSCEFCNTAGGKSDAFPVEKSHVAVKRLTVQEIDDLLERMTQSPKYADIFYLEPMDLDRLEGRLLLHPYYDNPEDHIYYEVDGKAGIWNNSAKGDWSIKVYHLDEQSKLDARREEQHEARGRYMNLMGATSDDLADLTNAAKKFMDEYYCGTKPYAAAVFDFIHFRLERTRYDPAELLGERRKKN